MLGLLAFSGVRAEEAQQTIRGLPIIRVYSFEEVGEVLSSIGRLSFDPLGQVSFVQDGSQMLLNDRTWESVLEKNQPIEVLQAISDSDGSVYYGGRGSWGRLVRLPNGKLRPFALAPTDPPDWAKSTQFTQILCQPEGIYFGGWNGVVFWERHTGEHRYFSTPGFTKFFYLDSKIHISCHERGVLWLDSSREKLLEAREVFSEIVINDVTVTSAREALISTSGRRLLVYRNGKLEALRGPLSQDLPGNIVSLQKLPEGLVAIAITNGGLYIADMEGRISLSLTGPDYQRITALGCNEPGVLWAVSHTGIIKILYDEPVTTFGQTLGLPVAWPQTVFWDSKTLVASNGRLYEPIPPVAGEPTRFQLVQGQPSFGVWGIAVAGPWLLLGNGREVVAKRAGGPFQTVIDRFDAARLVAIDPETCVVIGSREIAVVKLQDGVWRECAPRIPGFGYPSVVHQGTGSAWIELGANRAARVALQGNRIDARLFDSFPWPESGWINVSVLGRTVVLSGPNGQQLLFDEANDSFVSSAPELEGVFALIQEPAHRLVYDAQGTLWVTHDRGISLIKRHAAGYTVDRTTYDLITERGLRVQTPGDGNVWISSGATLLCIDQNAKAARSTDLRPILVSAVDERTGNELALLSSTEGQPRTLTHSQNSVTFNWFAGSYRLRGPPVYQFSLNDQPWRDTGVSSRVSLPDLPEGDYRLGVRIGGVHGAVGRPTFLEFSVAAPFYRTWYAIASYPLLCIGFLFGFRRIMLRRADARNAALEALVGKRTEELRAAMQKLKHETRIAATLAERNRVAAEIHDSLEQGFTGLTLLLETTSGFGGCPPRIRDSITAALNMIGYSRNEVRSAIQDLQSPLLEDADLEKALERMLAHLVPDPAHSSLSVTGPKQSLGTANEHALLRIAQEAVTNALKHARASHIDVQLKFRASDVELTVQDDGLGFDLVSASTPMPGHFGLASLRSRARRVGGTVEIESRPGAGTRITVRIAIPNSS